MTLPAGEASPVILTAVAPTVYYVSSIDGATLYVAEDGVTSYVTESYVNSIVTFTAAVP